MATKACSELGLAVSGEPGGRYGVDGTHIAGQYCWATPTALSSVAAFRDCAGVPKIDRARAFVDVCLLGAVANLQEEARELQDNSKEEESP